MEIDRELSPDLLGQAHQRAERLVAELERQKREVEARPPALGAEELAQGRQAMESALAAARRMLESLEEAMRAGPATSDPL